MNQTIRVVILSLAFSITAFSQTPAADTILIRGKVFTSNLDKPFLEAIAIRGQRILAVGTSEEIERLADAKTLRIDLQGHVVVPGFNDAHFHFAPDPKGFQLQFKTMEPTWEEVSAALSSAVQQTAKGTWIFGLIGHDVVLNEQVTRFALDRLAPDHPVLLRAYYGHGYILNSAAMPLLKIADDEANPAGGFFDRVANTKQINGRFWEYAEWKPNRILVSQVSDEEAIADLRQMAGEAVHFGVTSLQVFPSMPLDRFARLLAKADLPIRVRAISFSPTSVNGRDLSEVRQLGRVRIANPKVTVSGIKWILDGTPIERGAALRRDYDDRPGWRGRLNFPESEIDRMIKESITNKQQLLVHAVGDATIAAVLNAMERNGKDADWKRRRLRIEHGDGLIDELPARAQRFGVILVQNPTHFSDPQFFHARWGAKMQPLRSLIEMGIPVALGSDGPMNPLLNVMFATIHPANPGEAITREQAVRAYTFGSAFAEFTETEKGTIGPGKLADLAILSQDIFTSPPPELPNSVSIMTLVAGKIVFDAKVLRNERATSSGR